MSSEKNVGIVLDPFQEIIRVNWPRLGGWRWKFRALMDDLPPPLATYGFSITGSSQEPLSVSPWEDDGGTALGIIVDFPYYVDSPLTFTLSGSWAAVGGGNGPGHVTLAFTRYIGDDEDIPSGIVVGPYPNEFSWGTGGVTINVTFDLDAMTVSYSGGFA